MGGYSEDPEDQLVRASVAGHREAFDALVRRYQVRVFNLVRLLLGHDADAEDVTQDALVRAYRAIGRFRGESSFKTWLYRIAMNVAHAHRTRRSRTVTVSLDAEGGEAAGVEAGLAVPHDASLELANRDLIERALAALPPELRDAVVLRDLHDLSYREIAEALDVPIGTVESRIFRARARLRTLIDALGGAGRQGG